MALPNMEVKIIDETKASPPPGSVPTTSLPLTFFDMPWLFNVNPMQRPYFYKFPHTTGHFLETLLPSLKHSLPLTLQHFFPLAANLVCPPPPLKPHILYTDGDFAVSLTVAESSADFDLLLANDHPLDVRALDPFVPKWMSTIVEGDTRVEPLLAVQVTVFPNSGICITVQRNHVVADGKAIHHFMKSFALVSRTGGDMTRLERELRLPSHDRSAVRDSHGLEVEYLNQWWSLTLTLNDDNKKVLDSHTNDNVRATFVLSRDQIERLKSWIADQLTIVDGDNLSFNVSSFVSTCALVWVCLAKSDEKNSATVNIKDKYDKPYYFASAAECRSRLEFPLPTNYFGNCLTMCFPPAKWKVLLGENGIIAAAKAIGKEVAELNKGTFKLENWIMKFKKIKESGWQHVTVTGSPKFGVYEADFGWGKPERTESVHLKDSTTISLVESWDGKGGVEVGLALSKDRMSRFRAVLEQTLMKFA